MDTLAHIVGLSFLTLSWIVPQFIKNNRTKYLVGMLLSAFAIGIYLGAWLVKM